MGDQSDLNQPLAHTQNKNRQITHLASSSSTAGSAKRFARASRFSSCVRVFKMR